MIKIIAGKHKNKSIYTPNNSNTRPTSSRLKETIFNILEHSDYINYNLEYINVLDLFFGSGAFGLECLSRGARKVFFVEKHIPTLEILKKNIKILNCENKCQIIENDVTKLKEFSKISNHHQSNL